MSRPQLQSVVARTLQALKRQEDYPQLKASLKQGEDGPVQEKMEKITASLIVSPKSPWDPVMQPQAKWPQELFNLLRGKRESALELLKDCRVLKALMISPDLELLKEARSLMEDALQDIYQGACGRPLSDGEQLHLELIVGEILSLYPYLRPEEGASVNVPMRLDGEWKLIAYSLDRLEITPWQLGSPLVAYGLSSAEAEAPPLLLFKGTTYPADEGASLSVLTDLNPFAAVGSYAFAFGKKGIRKWLEERAAQRQAIVYGKSLGGALAQRAALHFPDKISKVMAHGAPGLSPWEQAKLSAVIKEHAHLTINVFCQKNDPVPYSDMPVSEGVHYYEVLGGAIQKNLVMAHMDMYALQERSSLLRLEPETIRSPWKRAAVTITRLIGSMLFGILLTCHIIKTLADHALALASYAWKKVHPPKAAENSV